jgi:hypothetical protein
METSEEKKCCENNQRSCLCCKMPGVFIALIGVAVLLGALDVLSIKTAGVTVGVLLILLGLKKIFAGMCKCCDKS